jgi:hypothetical protein
MNSPSEAFGDALATPRALQALDGGAAHAGPDSRRHGHGRRALAHAAFTRNGRLAVDGWRRIARRWEIILSLFQLLREDYASDLDRVRTSAQRVCEKRRCSHPGIEHPSAKLCMSLAVGQ